MTNTPVQELSTVRAARLDDAGAFWSGKIAEGAENARLTYTAQGSGEGAVATRVSTGGHEFVVDEPAGLAGDNAAASPVEYALGALASCQVVVYRLYAHQLGIRVDDITIDAAGDLDVRGLFGADSSVRPGFAAVRLHVRITGPETQERYEELRRTVDERCPVLDLFANATPVDIEVTAN